MSSRFVRPHLPILCALVGLLLWPASTVSGQEAGAEFSSPLVAGSGSLQFRIDSDLQLSSFQGAVLSYKKHLSAARAIRVGIGGTFREASSEGTWREFQGDSLLSEGRPDSESKLRSIELVAQYLRYSSPSSRVSPFLGIGPTFSYTWRESEQRAWQDIDAKWTSKMTEGFAGLKGSAGVEWFAANALSLHAEYVLVAGYQWGDRKETLTSFAVGSQDERSSEFDRWRLTSASVLLGCSLYF